MVSTVIIRRLNVVGMAKWSGAARDWAEIFAFYTITVISSAASIIAPVSGLSLRDVDHRDKK